MFQPAIFRIEDIETMHQLMLDHPFATLISSQNGHINADHLPLVLHPELSEKGVIRAHIAKGNSLWLERDNSMEALAIFHGPQAYISPNWYPSKKQHGKAVPTWNYAVVHAHGTLTFKTEDDWLLEHLVEISKRQEDDREDSWEVSDAPQNYLAKQFKGIVGVEIEITQLVGKWKVSQNKDKLDRAGVQEGLKLEDTEGAFLISDMVQQFSK